jgi:peptidyl-prolyl cis-trans isomerase B (cyclophilin B)
MARTNDPNSASSQFFINVKDNDFLNPTIIPPGDPVPKFEYQGRVYENTPRAQLVNAPQLLRLHRVRQGRERHGSRQQDQGRCRPARRPLPDGRSQDARPHQISNPRQLIDPPLQDTIMSNPKVELHIAEYGVITLELDAAKAPKTVANFLSYVNKGHYANTVFHRVIPGFMVQGGGFEPGMKQKPTDGEIENEASNGLKNDNYTVAMARTNAPHSASSQFFINVADNGFLNHTAPSASGWGYAVFGKVVGGADVVDKIKAVKTGRKGFHDDVPMEDVIIQKAVAGLRPAATA